MRFLLCLTALAASTAVAIPPKMDTTTKPRDVTVTRDAMVQKALDTVKTLVTEVTTLNTAMADLAVTPYEVTGMTTGTTVRTYVKKVQEVANQAQVVLTPLKELTTVVKQVTTEKMTRDDATELLTQLMTVLPNTKTSLQTYGKKKVGTLTLPLRTSTGTKVTTAAEVLAQLKEGTKAAYTAVMDVVPADVANAVGLQGLVTDLQNGYTYATNV